MAATLARPIIRAGLFSSRQVQVAFAATRQRFTAFSDENIEKVDRGGLCAVLSQEDDEPKTH